jgi:hypothetical protein
MENTENKLKSELKNEIYRDIQLKELRTKIASLTGLSEQSIRLWATKRDMRLLMHPIMLLLADHYKCQINELMK